MWRDEAYLLDMLLAARKVRDFACGATRQGFQKDEMFQQAVMRLIQIIGEAARNVSAECRQAHPEIPWQEIVGMRHKLVHEYFKIEVDKVWDVVENNISPLIAQLEPIIPPDSSEDEA